MNAFYYSESTNNVNNTKSKRKTAREKNSHTNTTSCCCCCCGTFSSSRSFSSHLSIYSNAFWYGIKLKTIPNTMITPGMHSIKLWPNSKTKRTDSKRFFIVRCVFCLSLVFWYSTHAFVVFCSFSCVSLFIFFSAELKTHIQSLLSSSSQSSASSFVGYFHSFHLFCYWWHIKRVARISVDHRSISWCSGLKVEFVLQLLLQSKWCSKQLLDYSTSFLPYFSLFLSILRFSFYF